MILGAYNGYIPGIILILGLAYLSFLLTLSIAIYADFSGPAFLEL